MTNVAPTAQIDHSGVCVVGEFKGLPPSFMATIETLQKMQPLIDTAQLSVQMREAAELVQSVRDAAEPFRLMQETIAKTLAPTNQMFAEIARQWQNGMGALLREVSESVRHFSVTARFWTIMLDLGWPPPFGVPTGMKEDIIRAHNEDGEAAAGQLADRLMLQVYDAERVASLTDEWSDNPLLSRRMPILSEVVCAHQEGRYVLAVPALLGQMEGMVADGFQHHGRMSQRKYEEYLKQLLESDDADLSDEIAKEFILTIVLAGFEHGQPLPSPLSRHAILHGADTDYGTATNSLKAILMFHYLQASFINPPMELSPGHASDALPDPGAPGRSSAG